MFEKHQSPRARWLSAAGVALVWALGCMPVLLGGASCPMAEIFGVPCPGCGMTRAIRLLGRLEIAASLRMHPLAAPCGATSLLFMFVTVWATAKLGSPTDAWRTRFGRASIVTFLVVEGAVFGLWVARFFGCFGGPVAV